MFSVNHFSMSFQSSYWPSMYFYFECTIDGHSRFEHSPKDTKNCPVCILLEVLTCSAGQAQAIVVREIVDQSDSMQVIPPITSERNGAVSMSIGRILWLLSFKMISTIFQETCSNCMMKKSIWSFAVFALTMEDRYVRRCLYIFNVQCPFSSLILLLTIIIRITISVYEVT